MNSLRTKQQTKDIKEIRHGHTVLKPHLISCLVTLLWSFVIGEL